MTLRATSPNHTLPDLPAAEGDALPHGAMAISAVLHAGAVAVAIWGLPFLFEERKIDDQPPVVILAEMAPIAEKTNPPPPAPKVAKPEPPKPEPPKPEPVKAPPPPPPPPAAQPEPAPAPPPKEVQAEPEPAPMPKAKPKPVEVAEPPPMPEPPKPRAKPAPPQQVQTPQSDPKAPSFDQVAALVNKLTKAQPTPPAPAQQTPVNSRPSPPTPIPSRLDQPVTQSERDFIRAQIEPKWNVDAGAKEAEKLVIRIRIAFNADGTLKGQPQIVNMGDLSTPYARSAAESARRAILIAQPIKFPPSMPRERWLNEEIDLIFNPKDMLGG